MSLEDIFEFDATSVATNARGELTPKQEETLQSYRKVSRFGTIIAFVAIIGTMIFMVGLVFFSGDIETSGMQQALPYIGGTFGAVLLIFTIFWLWGIKRASNIRSGKISEVTGIAQLQIKKRQYHKEYYVTIGKVRFQMGIKAQYNAFTEGESYHVYYIHYPPTHVILSVASD